MNSVEVSGKTLEEARAAAAQRLGVSEEDLSVEVLEEPRKLFGILGAAEYRIRATAPDHSDAETVFTARGSATRIFKVYNDADDPVQIDRIEVAGETGVDFTFNVDGIQGPAAEQVVIFGRDSIFVFVEVEVDPSDPVAVSPFIGGETVKGPAADIMRSLGHDPTPAGLSGLYDGLIDHLVVDPGDAGAIDDVHVHPSDIVIGTREQAARLAKEMIEWLT